MRSPIPFLCVMLSACASASGGLPTTESLSVEELGLPSVAQAAAGAKPLGAGAARAASITDADPVFSDTSRYQIWRFDATPGRRTTVKVVSAAFAPFLVVASPAGDSLEVLGTNESENGEARVSFEAIDRGPFYVFVNAARSQDRGAYTLRAGPYEPPVLLLGDVPVSDRRRLERANTAVSTLGEGDRTLNDQSLYQVWRFTGRKGERLALTMASSEFRPYLIFGRLVRDSLIVEGRSPPSARGDEAALLAELERDGEYLVVANGASPEDRGRYTLRLEPMDQPEFPLAASALAKAGTLVPGSPQAATLSTGDAVLGDRTHYQVWRFEGKAGEPVMVTMSSTGIDPYLYLGTIEGEQLRVLKSNDDRGYGTEARVRLTLPKTGTYIVVANALNASDLGPYRIRLEKNRGGMRLR